ncbi:MAG: hypothetical protein ACYC0V_19875 [Armatimonadota bacterium]
MKITRKLVKKVNAKAYEAFTEKPAPTPPSILTDWSLLLGLGALT